ncbi:MAG: diacylglycerol kinase [Tissierellia bacterium]|nr:diacylglycerol kinase [Tissierellia bacterium]
MNSDKKVKKGKIINGFNFAIDGLIYAVTKEYNMRFHVVTAIVVLLLTMLFDLSKIEIALIGIAITLVFITEMINTAIEKTVDLATSEYRELAKIAKDVAAGAVLIAALNSVFMAYLIFSNKFMFFTQNVFMKIRRSKSHIAFLTIMLILLLVVLLKSIFHTKNGSHVQGGAVSGHSALAFSIATILSFMTNQGMVIIFSFVLAFLVAESRVEGGIHAISEVIMGALLGMAATVLVFKILI